MTLQVFSRDIVPIIHLGVVTLGLAGIFLLWWQIRQTTLWNKLNSPYNFLDVERTTRLEKEVFAALRALTIDPNLKLTVADVTKILKDDNAQLTLKAYLNDVENVCAAVRIGSVDKDCAYAVHSTRVVEIAKRNKNFVKAVQDFYRDPEIYIEMQKVAAEWEKRALKDRSKEQIKLQRLQSDLDQQKGVKTKV